MEGKSNEPMTHAISRTLDGPTMRGLIWFRRDLRLHDNLAVATALAHVATHPEMTLIPLYIIHRPKMMLCGVNRFQFLIESISHLSDTISEYGSHLMIARGESVDVLKHVIPAWNITHLFFDQVTEPFAIKRDQQVIDFAQAQNVKVTTTNGYMLYDMDAVISKSLGHAPKTYKSFLQIISTLPIPAKPLNPPKILPPCPLSPSELYHKIQDHKQIAGPEQNFGLPTIQEFGYTPPERHSFLYGGEAIALKILDQFCLKENQVAQFEKPKTSPAMLKPASSTTSLSPYLYFGCLSPRIFYHRIREIQAHTRSCSTPPVSLDGQLLWREFFHCHGHVNPYFDKMEENPQCLQVNWQWHQLPSSTQLLNEGEKKAREQFEAWKEGQTGFPWIDAIMIQLKQEGWIHHLARHSVACFLTRGDLYISWIRGLEVFQERLIDHDWSLNCGNWLWLSASAFFTSYFRVYSPISFGKKWDPHGQYIRKYVPALKNIPDKYIYEPWKAPISVQRTAHCIIGKDYPYPIVDHTNAMKECMAGMKQAYALHQHGVMPQESISPVSKRPRHD